MTKEEEQNLQVLQTRVRQLILAYNELQRQNSRLAEELRLCKDQQQQAEALRDQAVAQYNNLKAAKILEVSGEDVKATRARLAKLIKLVDKSIARLNV
ncbi:MAG: hypothetical protein ACI4V2_03070 [Alloprevotella sp.]